ncbi:DNA-binding response regulator [Nitratireductor aestuarii]|uniref:DNA-binding response regulator n=1 Tax=Nitratireductor aestuarii TaxID=1735103 RepID=A0A916W933_9HYPH|nr:response regulator transcription factor [Nitratireductor aestuarii]GGA77990.1 DNA-binding response regulator [Nitratireductor aestuarii]
MSERVRVVVVDDHPLFRSGVVQALELDEGIEVVAEGGSASEAIELAEKHHPDVMLLDISLPGGDGIAAATAIAVKEEAPRILMLTVSGETTDVMRAVDAGAAGYVLKGINATDLIHAVKSVAAGETFMSPNLSFNLLTALGKASKPDPLATLTPQERRILQMVATGLGNREIGVHLGVGEKTVKFHVTNLFRKLNVRNRVEAALILAERGQDRGMAKARGAIDGRNAA